MTATAQQVDCPVCSHPHLDYRNEACVSCGCDLVGFGPYRIQEGIWAPCAVGGCGSTATVWVSCRTLGHPNTAQLEWVELDSVPMCGYHAELVPDPTVNQP